MGIGSIAKRSIITGALSVQIPVTARAQPAYASPVEVWGAFSGVITAPSGTLVSTYSPPLLLDGAFTSSASQTLTIEGNRAPAWQAGVNLFPSRFVGVQILADRASMDVSGTNGPYEVVLNYISRPPPNSQPVPVEIRTSSPWPDTTGSLTQLALGFNIVARTEPGAPVSASVSGGLSYYRLTGTVQSLGFTEFHLGGHSTLFSEEFRMVVEPDNAGVFGFNVGGDVGVGVGRHAAIVGGYRFLGGPKTDVPVRIAAIANADQIVFSDTVENIAKLMAVPPAKLRVSGSRIIAGLKVIF